MGNNKSAPDSKKQTESTHQNQQASKPPSPPIEQIKKRNKDNTNPSTTEWQTFSPPPNQPNSTKTSKTHPKRNNKSKERKREERRKLENKNLALKESTGHGHQLGAPHPPQPSSSSPWVDESDESLIFHTTCFFHEQTSKSLILLQLRSSFFCLCFLIFWLMAFWGSVLPISV